MRLRYLWVEKVPCAGSVTSALNQKLESAELLENFPFTSGVPLMIQACLPLPGPTPAKSSGAVIEKGTPVWNCETALIAQPPRSLPLNRDLFLKKGSS